MAAPTDREEVFEVTVNALTTKAAPREEPTQFSPGTVVSIEAIIPDGVAGLAGFQIWADGRQLFPDNSGAWILGNDDTITRNVYNWPNSGRLSVHAYNEDNNAHTFTIRYAIAEIPLPPPREPTASSPLGVTPEGALAPTSEPSLPEGPPAGEQPEPVPGEPPPPPPGPEPPPPPPAPEPPPPGEPPAPPASGEPAAPQFPGAEPEAAPTLEAGAEPPAASGAPHKPGTRKHPSGKKTRTKTERVTYPAGGWLPPGARFTVQRTDQGQDGITRWHGEIVAPGDGQLVHNLSDKPFPSGFGPRYAVVRITTGPFAGHDWYVGHCTSDLNPGQRFKQGDVVAFADQGHIQGGGWFEIGEAPNGYPGPMGTGAKWAHLFHNVTVVRRLTVNDEPPKRSKTHPRPRKPGAVRRKPHPGAPGTGHHGPAAKRRPPGKGAGSTHGPGARRAPQGAAHGHPGGAPAARRPPARAAPGPARRPAAAPPPKKRRK